MELFRASMVDECARTCLGELRAEGERERILNALHGGARIAPLRAAARLLGLSPRTAGASSLAEFDQRPLVLDCCPAG